MTTATAPLSTAKDEASIRAIMDAWARAIEAKNLDALMAHYAPDVLLYDLKPPYKIVGVPAYKAMWEACLPYFPQKFRSVSRDINLVVGADTAFVSYLNKFEVDGEPHPCAGSWIRVTAGFKKISGKWLIVHEHVSLPYNPMNNTVVQITDPNNTTFDWGAACAEAAPK
jgi:ketosteroid isomerase-like protein